STYPDGPRSQRSWAVFLFRDFPDRTHMKLRQRLGSANTVVVKIGTKVLIDREGSIARDVFERLARSVAALREQGRRVLLVSSGAVGLGARSLGVSPSM